MRRCPPPLYIIASIIAVLLLATAAPFSPADANGIVPKESHAEQAAGKAPANESANAPLASHWAGTSKTLCGPLKTDFRRCNAQQKIKFDLVQTGINLRGTYECAYGNATCRGSQNKGTVTQGTLDGTHLEMVVTTPNKSNCRYRGVLTDIMGKGTYKCVGGSELEERGTWRIQRADAD